MQTFNLRHQLNLRWTQALIIALLLIGGISNVATAQNSAKSRTINMPEYDYKWLHYGFQIGLFNYGLKAKYTDSGNRSIRTNRNMSFSLGFITDFRLKDNLWSLRVLPNVSFYERSFTAVASDGTTTDAAAIEATVVEFPVLLKYKSRRRKNHRMYMIGGLTGTWEVGGKAVDGISFKKNNLEVSYGAGFDMYCSFFKFSPEIRFSHGLFNLLDNGVQIGTIDRVYTHKVALYLNFE